MAMTETKLHLLMIWANFTVTTVNSMMHIIQWYGEHIFILEIEISKSWMNQNDENLSDLELKSFWYKSDKKAFVYV